MNEENVNEDAIGYKKAIGAYLIKNYDGEQTAISETCTLKSLSNDDNPPFRVQFDLTTPEGKACMSDLVSSHQFNILVIIYMKCITNWFFNVFYLTNKSFLSYRCCIKKQFNN